MFEDVFLEARDATDEVSVHVVAVSKLVGEVEIEALEGQESDTRGDAVEVVGFSCAGQVWIEG